MKTLVEARGDRRLPAPRLVFNDGEQFVAWMDPKTGTVGIEEKAYAICASFGPDSLSALAMLLAHELTHYYEKHDWTQHFVYENENTESARQLEALDEGLKQEAQADQLGNFLALSAGYHPLGLAPELLKRVYENYGLPADNAGYPSFSDRQEIARQAQEEVRRLSDIFTTATCLIAAGQYADAALYYDFLLRNFQSRELYNNAGLAKLLAALLLFEDEEQPLAYPLELDAESRLSTQSRDPQVNPQERRAELLSGALLDFERAAALDKHYAVALLNCASAYTLMGAYDDARYFLGKAEKLAGPSPKTLADVEVLRGILAYYDGNKVKALELFDKAAALGSPLGLANQRRLEGHPVVKKELVNNQSGVERIDSLLLDRYLGELLIDEQQSISDEVICASRQLPHSRIMVNFIGNGHRYAVFHLTQADYPGTTTQGIKIGDSGQAIMAAYGEPHSTLELAQGQLLIYTRQKLIFRLDGEGRLDAWIIYRI